jgi:dimethylargininase
MSMPVALVRPVPAAYASCLRHDREPIDVSVARRQHAGYVSALRDAGYEVVTLPALDDAPDSVFVEDPVVVLDRHAVLARAGAASRRVEVASIAPALDGFELVTMTAPATLDGGDVLRMGRRLFVGISERTNRSGFEVLAAVARSEGIEATAVALAAGLHLKSFCSGLGDAVIGCFDRIDRTAFEGIETIDAPELAGANLLDLGAHVLVSAAAPKTAALVGERARVVDVGEFHKGDGALTCLSIRLTPPRRTGR